MELTAEYKLGKIIELLEKTVMALSVFETCDEYELGVVHGKQELANQILSICTNDKTNEH